MAVKSVGLPMVREFKARKYLSLIKSGMPKEQAAEQIGSSVKQIQQWASKAGISLSLRHCITDADLLYVRDAIAAGQDAEAACKERGFSFSAIKRRALEFQVSLWPKQKRRYTEAEFRRVSELRQQGYTMTEATAESGMSNNVAYCGGRRYGFNMKKGKKC